MASSFNLKRIKRHLQLSLMLMTVLLKEFTEIMRQLHYPGLISIDSFRKPNFELLADILLWIVKQLDPTIPLHDSIGTEDDRVLFLNGITSELATRMNVYLNTRHLYAANGYAVRELLKVAKLMNQALMLAQDSSIDEETIPQSVNVQSAKKAQHVAREITEIAAKLHELLKHEDEDREKRTDSIKFLNLVYGLNENGSEKDHIHMSIGQILERTKDQVERLEKQCEMLISSEKGIEEKIRKKSIDYEHNMKRFESLNSVRPAFMDEYEEIEEKLQFEYERYIVRRRNIDYLEGELRSLSDAAAKRNRKIARSAKHMQKKFREEEQRILEGSDISDGDEAEQGMGSDSGERYQAKNDEIQANIQERMDSFIDANTEDISIIEISSSACTTPRDHSSKKKSNGSPSVLSESGHSLENTMTSSDITGSESFNTDDNF